jgi:hypothetical protein
LRRVSGRVAGPATSLPTGARALRLSADGRTVAFVTDERRGDETVPVGWLTEGGATRRLGVLGLRAREAMGLAVSHSGRAYWMDEAGVIRDGRDGAELGRGAWLVGGPGDGVAWIDAETHCLTARPDDFVSTACDRALRPLHWTDAGLLATDGRTLSRFDSSGTQMYPVSHVVDARLGPDGRIAVIRKAWVDDVEQEELFVLDPLGVRGLGRFAVIVSAEWDDDGTLLVVRRRERRDIYELLLAHAPEEFGGEALAGEALRIDPATGREAPLDGVADQPVRLVVRARVR